MATNPNDVVVTLRLPRELHDEIRKSARENERSAAAELRLAARKHVEATKGASAEQAAA
jgi:Arc-like DNA binding domain